MVLILCQGHTFEMKSYMNPLLYHCLPLYLWHFLTLVWKLRLPSYVRPPLHAPVLAICSSLELKDCASQPHISASNLIFPSLLDHSQCIGIFCTLSNLTKINNSLDPAWPTSQATSLISFEIRLIKSPSNSLPLIPFFCSPIYPFQAGFSRQHNEIALVRVTSDLHIAEHSSQFLILILLKQRLLEQNTSSLLSPFFAWLLGINYHLLLFHSPGPSFFPFFAGPSLFLFPKPLLQNFNISHNFLNLDFGLGWLLHSIGIERGHLMPFSWWLIWLESFQGDFTHVLVALVSTSGSQSSAGFLYLLTPSSSLSTRVTGLYSWKLWL